MTVLVQPRIRYYQLKLEPVVRYNFPFHFIMLMRPLPLITADLPYI